MASWNEQYEPVIGLEVHAQLRTKTKAFCSCSAQFGDSPNANVCPVCLGMPGTLPVLNKNLVEYILRVGLATHCAIRPVSIFARKNYFYPDLPKGYQISQFEDPICEHGWVERELEDGTKKRIGIKRIHMEEDAGKSIHDLDADTLVDLNRCGVPLIEIVSDPDIRSPREAYWYLVTMRQIVTYLGVCDGNMEEGSLRCDANISVRKKGATTFGTKTELKNMNSFRFVEKALEYEINRQIDLIESGGTVKQETLLWDSARDIAVAMRSKEEAHDYRYFPDPDLVPVHVDEKWIGRVRSELPEFPAVKRDRFVKEYGIPKYDADILTAERETAEYFEGIIASLPMKNADTFKMASNWTMTDVLRVINERHIPVSDFPIPASSVAEMIGLIAGGTISGKIAKDIFEEMLAHGGTPKSIVEKKGLVQVSDSAAIEKVIDEVLQGAEDEIAKFLSGRQQVFSFFVGETMKRMKGKANPKIVNDILRAKLEARRA